MKLLLTLSAIFISMNSTAQQSIKTFWEGQFLNTVEQNVITINDKITIDGYITGSDRENNSINIRYQIDLDENWNFRDVKVWKHNEQMIHLTRSGKEWMLNNTPRQDFSASSFIDINVTPFTNTLPIRNLDFSQTKKHEMEVVYIDVLKNEVSTAHQTYTYISDNHYQYANMDSGFSRTMEVDSFGLVVNYPGIWRRIEYKTAFENVLPSTSPSPSIPEEADIYGWLIGSWKAEVIDYRDDGSKLVQSGEWHFSRALEGRAIQDVWIVPSRGSRDEITTGNRYGTSIRVYDSITKKWNLTWCNPVTGAFDILAGTKEDADLLHIGKDENGNTIRWSFREIKEDSFHWTGEISTDGGNTWKLQAEFFCTRSE